MDFSPPSSTMFDLQQSLTAPPIPPSLRGFPLPAKLAGHLGAEPLCPTVGPSPPVMAAAPLHLAGVLSSTRHRGFAPPGRRSAFLLLFGSSTSGVTMASPDQRSARHVSDLLDAIGSYPPCPCAARLPPCSVGELPSPVPARVFNITVEFLAWGVFFWHVIGGLVGGLAGAVRDGLQLCLVVVAGCVCE